MVAKIYTGETPVQELQGKFTDELKQMGKDAAIRMGCNVDELKYRITNSGIIEFERMSGEEMAQMQVQEAQQKQIISVKSDRGVLYE